MVLARARAEILTLIVGMGCSIAAAPTSQRTQASRPAGTRTSSLAEHSAEQKANSAVSAAVRDLLREYTSGKLRTASDYFHQHASPDLTPKAIVAALEQKFVDDPAASAYVKWQLLSGIGEKFDDALVARVIQAYHAAPEPLTLPGDTQEERSKLELARRNARKEDIPKLNQEIAETQQQRERQNAPVLAYRNELFAKLPPENYDVLKAGFEDAYTRMKAGAETQSIMDPLIKQTRSWMASTTATAEQLNEMAHLVATLSKERSPEFYSDAEWSERSYRVNWHKKRYDLNKYGQLDKLAKDLAEAARSGPAATGGLKFKDEKKKKD